MPNITPPELQGLVAIAREEGLDMKPVLLRVLVDLFIGADGHSPDEVAQFQEIAGTLSREVDADTAVIVACKLAGYPATPSSVGEALISRKDDAARIILADAGWLPRYILVEQAAAGNRLLAAAVAARAGLEPSIVRLLLSRRDPLVDTTLAANTALRLATDSRAELLARACVEETIARALLSRGDLQPIERAALFLVADKTVRTEILESVEAFVAAEDERSTPIAAPPELVAGLETAARSGDAQAFRAMMSLGLGTSPEKVTRVIEDRSGEALAIALVALGVPDEAATRIFMFRDPLIGQSTQRVFALVDLSRRISPEAALLITSSVLGTQSTRAATPVHAPVYDPAIPAARPVPVAANGAGREYVQALRGAGR
jgi:uncharacterized protein (DUF2336 family)